MLGCQYSSRRHGSANHKLIPRPPTTSLSERRTQKLSHAAKQASPVVFSAAVSSQQGDVTDCSSVLDVSNQEPSENQAVTWASIGSYPEQEIPWFLTLDSWEIKPGHIIGLPQSSLFKSFVKMAQNFLREWATHGHNIFIHRHLYKPGFPNCLEDAYTTLVTYLSRTEETEELVLQIVENRATSLCQQSILLEGVETLDAKAHLARTQALLVYTLIRLFDGCPRQRASAEDTLCTLYEWSRQMREAAISEVSQLCNELESLRSDYSGLELAIWRAWILSESLRRTWMLVSGTVNIYQTKKDGWAGCGGFLLFTTRDGLWDAPNAWQWMQQVQKRGPLFRQSGNLLELMEEASSAEVDAFTNQVISIVLSPERLDRWIAKET